MVLSSEDSSSIKPGVLIISMRVFLNFTILCSELDLLCLADVTRAVGVCGRTISFTFDEDATLSMTHKPYKKLLFLLMPPIHFNNIIITTHLMTAATAAQPQDS